MSTSVILQYQTMLYVQQFLARFLTLNVPTFCVQNGITMAGGLLLSLMFDFRTMREDDKNFVSFSELNIGKSMTPAFAAAAKYQLEPTVSRLMMWGGRFNAQQALKMKVVDNVYKTKEELEQQILQFAKAYAPKGAHRNAIKAYKLNMHHETYQALTTKGLAYIDLLDSKPFDMSIVSQGKPQPKAQLS